MSAVRRAYQTNQTGTALQFLLRDLPEVMVACARVVFGLRRAPYAGLDCQYSSARKIILAWLLMHNAVIHNAQTNLPSFDSV